MFSNKTANIGLKLSLGGLIWYGLAMISGVVAVVQSLPVTASVTAGNKAYMLMWVFFLIGLLQCMGGIVVMIYGVLKDLNSAPIESKE